MTQRNKKYLFEQIFGILVPIYSICHFSLNCKIGKRNYIMKHVCHTQKKLIRSSRKKILFFIGHLSAMPPPWILDPPPSMLVGVCCYCRRFCCLILRSRGRRRHIAKKDRMGGVRFLSSPFNSPELQGNKTRTDSVQKVCGGIWQSLGRLPKLRKIKTHLKVKSEAQGMPR